MFTIFDDELDSFARKTLAAHRRFDAGGWNDEELRTYQLHQLKETLRYVVDGSPFYRRRLAGLGPEAIAGLTPESFARLPFTTKSDLREQTYDMLSRPVSDAWIFYETTGTTGPATPCPRDNVDSLVNNTALTVCYEPVLGRTGEPQVVGVMGPSELHSTGDTFGDVCRNLGHAVAKMWPRSPVVGTRRALDLLRRLSVGAIFCAPNVAISLARDAVEAGFDPRDFSLSTVMLTGELATPGLLANIGAAWGATAYNCLYASQEASVLGAVHGDGLLRTIPLNVFYEIIDPETGLTSPVRDGRREGELVVTHLYRGSKPLVRYRTGDLVRLTAAEKGAAYPSETMVPLGRVRDVLSLNGHRVTAHALEDLILSRLPDALDYQITIQRTDGPDGPDDLVVDVESRDGTVPDPEGLRELVAAAERAWNCRLTVSYGRPGGVTATGAMVSWKAARVQDLRQEPDAERQVALALASSRGEG